MSSYRHPPTGDHLLIGRSSPWPIVVGMVATILVAGLALVDLALMLNGG